MAARNLRPGRNQLWPHRLRIAQRRPAGWEINTNPTIARHARADPLTEDQKQLRAPVRQHFHPRFQAAWEAIDSPADPMRTISVKVSQRQRRRLAVERERRSRIQSPQNRPRGHGQFADPSALARCQSNSARFHFLKPGLLSCPDLPAQYRSGQIPRRNQIGPMVDGWERVIRPAVSRSQPPCTDAI